MTALFELRMLMWDERLFTIYGAILTFLIFGWWALGAADNREKLVEDCCEKCMKVGRKECGHAGVPCGDLKRTVRSSLCLLALRRLWFLTQQDACCQTKADMLQISQHQWSPRACAAVTV